MFSCALKHRGCFLRCLPGNHVRLYTAPKKTLPMINDRIKADKMRVIYEINDKVENKIMERSEALDFAKKMKLDLVLVNGSSDPIVCKVENYNLKIREKEKTVKLQKQAAANAQSSGSAGSGGKLKAAKEIYIRGGIDPHDFSTKVNKLKNFLTSNVPVKVSLVEKKNNLRKNPGSIRDLNKQLLDALGELDVNVVQQRSVVAERQDIMFTPKKAGSNESSITPNASNRSHRQ